MNGEHEFDPRYVDLVLGQVSEEERAELTARLDASADDAVAVGDLRVLFDDLCGLEAEPTGRVGLAVRYSAARRAALRGADREPWSTRLGRLAKNSVRVAAVAAVVLVMLLYGRELREPGEAGDVVAAAELPETTSGAPIAGTRVPGMVLPEFEEILTRGGADLSALAEHLQALRGFSGADVFGSLVAADNDLSILRLEFVQRFSRQARRRSIRAGGGRADLEDRIQDLAAHVAVTIEARLDDEPAVGETALALRALMAAGSTPRIGPHRRTVVRCVDVLRERVGDLEGGKLASALAALTDLAVITYGSAGALVGEHGRRLARATLFTDRVRAPHGGSDQGGEAVWRRPPLLRFDTPVAELADAGYVLRFAPAFGVHPRLAHRARLLVAAHVEERLHADAAQRPEVLAAQSYGFGDLVDRRVADRKLRLWHPHLLLPDYRALHHLAWGQFPLRPGWSRFQQELRGLASLRTPDGVEDASALLLCLAMNFAAPGAHEVLELSR